MGRPGLTRHRKFARLTRLLGSAALARGHLELIWEVAYENGDDLLGDAGDVELLAQWQGEAGALAAALVESGFVDLEANEYRVHDLYDHAPEYVRKRADREAARQAKGITIREIRAAAASARWEKWNSNRTANGQQTAASGNHLHATGSKRRANGTPPAPAPAPIEALPSATPPAPNARRIIAGLERTRISGLTTLMAGVYQDVRGEKYAHGGAKDTKALGRLVKLADNAEILRRWRRALDLGAKWPGCSTFAQLASKWNDLAAPAGGNVRPAPELLDLIGTDENGFTIYGKGSP
jgi:hypothetical protein